MKTLPRTPFLIYANLVWLAQFAAEFLVGFAPDAIAWRQRVTESLQVGCVGDTAAYDPTDRLFLFALMWIISAPLMTVIALRLPANWPDRMERPFWNNAAPAVSLLTLAVVLALLAWPIAAARSTPVTSVILTEIVRGLAIAAAAIYYRGILLRA
jgi:hypothetical protein